MKKSIVLLFSAITLSGIAFASHTYDNEGVYDKIRKEEKEKKDSVKAVQIADSMKAMTFRIEATNVFPSGNFRPRSLTGEYYFEVRDSVLKCYLPYFGISRKAFMGSSLAVESEGGKIDPKMEYDSRKRCYELEFDFVNDPTGEILEAYLLIYDTGKSVLTLSSTYRDLITYMGEIRIDEPKNE